jgi:hypothetical protein
MLDVQNQKGPLITELSVDIKCVGMQGQVTAQWVTTMMEPMSGGWSQF